MNLSLFYCWIGWLPYTCCAVVGQLGYVAVNGLIQPEALQVLANFVVITILSEITLPGLGESVDLRNFRSRAERKS